MGKGKAVIFIAGIVLCISLGFRSGHFSLPSAPVHFNQASPLSNRVDSHPTPWMALYDSLQLGKLGLSKMAFLYGYAGYQQMDLEKSVLAIADFSQSSRKKRLYVIDFQKKKLLLHTYVAHGRNSGVEFASKFSNRNSSFQSSLGFYKTMQPYQGKHGLSLRLQGIEKGINDHAYERAIVVHGADYVSERFINSTGRLGRSQGCPAVPIKDHTQLIQSIQGGAALFVFSPDRHYLNSSNLLTNISEILMNASDTSLLAMQQLTDNLLHQNTID